ncbi:hypothetical protein Fmac_032084 [Flemingia macrophylla]|uniref:Uncharacterized protein n=1 Tax=Flemingia macrophylla TaxID=520843 RepID=A0ABD1L3W2_9FABA
MRSSSLFLLPKFQNLLPVPNPDDDPRWDGSLWTKISRLVSSVKFEGTLRNLELIE